MNSSEVMNLVKDLNGIFDEANVPSFDQISNPVVRVTERAQFLATYYSNNVGAMTRAIEALDRLRDTIRGTRHDGA